MVASGPQVIVVNPSLPVNTVKELIELAKAKPGTLNYGHAGIGSQTHLAAESFLFTTGLNIKQIPYKGEGPAIGDLVAGQINLATPTCLRQSALSTAASFARWRLPVRSARRRCPLVPTVAETVSGFENIGWFGRWRPQARRSRPSIGFIAMS